MFNFSKEPIMIILYTTGCPKCAVLEKKLEQKGVVFEKITDVSEIRAAGVTSVPTLFADGSKMSFLDAVRYVNSL